MKKQNGFGMVLWLVAISLTIAFWGYMRWSNHQLNQSLKADVDRLLDEISTQQSSISGTEDNNRALTEELVAVRLQLKSDAANFLLEKQSLTENVSRLEAQLETGTQALAVMASDKQVVETEVLDLQARLVEKVEGITVLEQALTAQTSGLESLAQEKEILTNGLVGLKEQVTQSESEVAILQENLVQKVEGMAILEQELTVKSSDLEVLRQEKQTLNNDLASLKQQVTQSEADVARLLDERNGIAQEVLELKTQLGDLNASSTKLNRQYVRVQSQLESEVKRSQDYSQKLETLEEQYGREQSALVALEDELSSYRNNNQSLQAINSSLQNEKISLLDTNQQLGAEKNQLIQQYENGISVIRLPSRILFDTGSASLNAQGRETLLLVARTLQEFPDYLISVEGHTDHRPIGSVLARQYPTNWELSSARAASAIRVLIAGNVPAQQFQLVGFGDTRPLVEKINLDELHQNRRIEILLLPPVERKQSVLKLSE